MKVISIANIKGGVGKTTTSINLAAGLKNRGKKVILIDIDPQGNLTQSLGLPKVTGNSIHKVLRKKVLGEKVSLKNIIVNISDLDIIPSSLGLPIPELDSLNELGHEQILAQMIPYLTSYDFVLIDCPPDMGQMTIYALTASHYVLIPLQAEFLPLKGARSFLKQIDRVRKQNKKIQLLGFVLTKYNPRNLLNQRVRAELIKEFSRDKVFETHIRSNTALPNALKKSMDIFAYNKNSQGASDYYNLTTEFLSKFK